MFIETFFKIEKIRKHPRCSFIDEYINKMCHLHTMECYSEIKSYKVLMKPKRSLGCCSPWGHKESDMTGQLNNKPHKDMVET